MPVITNPLNIAVATSTTGKAVASELVLQPGTVVDAQVIAARANLVKIVITGMMIEVLSEVQLQPGTALKLAVSQTADGLRLAVVDRPLPDQTGPRASAPLATTATTTGAARVIGPSLQPDQSPVRAASVEPTNAMQAAAVSQAARTAAPVQASLSSLFANLPVIVASAAIPPDVKAAAAQLLATRPALTENLNADDIRNAFRSSGVLFEASIAKGASPTSVPDLKAALVVFRQILSGWAATTAPQQIATPVVTEGETVPALSTTAQTDTSKAVTSAVTSEALAGEPADATSVRVAGNAISRGPDAPVKDAGRPPGSVASPPPANGVDADPSIVHETVRAVRDQQGMTIARLSGAIPADDDQAAPKFASTATLLTTARPSAEPAPPFRGSAPSVQPIALPSIDPQMPASHMAARLLDQTDGALARQTLLQVASLPERFDASSVSQPQQRWAFEIPFMTPQGTAVAQFEIADEGGGMAEGGAPKRIWRARFTLDIESTGPVHALISLTGEKTTVRMWAERPDTVAQLRDNTQALDSAMRLADLEPGDIVVQGGAPPQPKPARAGHFLDRAT